MTWTMPCSRTRPTYDRRYTTRLRDLVVAGRAHPARVVTHHRTLDDAPGFFERFDQRTDGVIRRSCGRTDRRGPHAPEVWKRRPIAKPTAAAPSPITTICSPFFRQSPTRETAW
jgi:hypothetical protein